MLSIRVRVEPRRAAHHTIHERVVLQYFSRAPVMRFYCAAASVAAVSRGRSACPTALHLVSQANTEVQDTRVMNTSSLHTFVFPVWAGPLSKTADFPRGIAARRRYPLPATGRELNQRGARRSHDLYDSCDQLYDCSLYLRVLVLSQ